MAPSPLHGLNIVQQDTPSSDQYADSQDPLLANAHFPDLAAQLDLWSNLTFQTDEPLLDRPHASHKPSLSAKEDLAVGEDDKDDDIDAEGPASLEGHVNAVNPATVPNTPVISQHHQQQQNYDMGALLAGFGIDPFMVPQVAAPPPPQAATLAQLLAAYPFANPPFLAPAHVHTVSPAALSGGPQSGAGATPAPAKRPRARKASTAFSSSSRTADDDEDAEEDGTPTPSTGPLSPAEDKRRRNTAASARFRMKKKEREAALERRAQDLEARVSTLERECEGLRRENGWLKGLVVGVTGASQGAAQVVQAPNSNANSNANAGQNQTSGAKRKRAAAEEGREGKKVSVAA